MLNLMVGFTFSILNWKHSFFGKFGIKTAKNIMQTKIQVSEKLKQNTLTLLSNCANCGKKKLTFIKNKELHSFNNIWND